MASREGSGDPPPLGSLEVYLRLLEVDPPRFCGDVWRSHSRALASPCAGHLRYSWTLDGLPKVSAAAATDFRGFLAFVGGGDGA